MFLKITRIHEMNAPLELMANSAADWTHFEHIHRRSHLDFKLLWKQGSREIFLYKARLIYPLPFSRTFIVFREYLPEQLGYRQYYLNTRTGKVHQLESSTVKAGENAATVGTFHFSISRLWKFFPRTFLKLFHWRMRGVMLEDEDWISERLKNGVFENKGCGPVVADRFNLIDELISKGPPDPELELIDKAKT